MGDEIEKWLLGKVTEGATKHFTSEPVQTAAEVDEKGVGKTITDHAANAAADAAGDKVTEFLWDLAQSAVDGTQYVGRAVMELLMTATKPQVDGQFIYDMGGRVFFISLPLIVLFAALRIAIDSVRAGALVGAGEAFVGVAGSVLGTMALVPLTGIAVQAVDGAGEALMDATMDDADGFVDDLMDSVVDFGTVIGNMVGDSPLSGPVAQWQVPASGLLATVVICLLSVVLVVISFLIIGLALVARNMLLYATIVMGPLCLSGLAWKPTRRWATKWLSWHGALIFTKLAIVVVMGLGVLAIAEPMASGGDSDLTDYIPAFATMLSGILLLIMAGFMPIACFALFGWAGEQALGAVSGAAMAATGMLTRAPEKALKETGQAAKDRLGSLLSGSDSNSGLAGGSGQSSPGGGGGPSKQESGSSSDESPSETESSGTSSAGSTAAAAAAGGGVGALLGRARQALQGLRDRASGGMSDEAGGTDGEGTRSTGSGPSGVDLSDGGEQGTGTGSGDGSGSSNEGDGATGGGGPSDPGMPPGDRGDVPDEHSYSYGDEYGASSLGAWEQSAPPPEPPSAGTGPDGLDDDSDGGERE